MSPGHSQLAETAQQPANDIAYDPSAVTILEEAITLGIVPPFRSVFCIPTLFTSLFLHFNGCCNKDVPVGL